MYAVCSQTRVHLRLIGSLLRALLGIEEVAEAAFRPPQHVHGQCCTAGSMQASLSLPQCRRSRRRRASPFKFDLNLFCRFPRRLSRPRRASPSRTSPSRWRPSPTRPSSGTSPSWRVSRLGMSTAVLPYVAFSLEYVSCERPAARNFPKLAGAQGLQGGLTARGLANRLMPGSKNPNKQP